MLSWAWVSLNGGSLYWWALSFLARVLIGWFFLHGCHEGLGISFCQCSCASGFSERFWQLDAFVKFMFHDGFFSSDKAFIHRQ